MINLLFIHNLFFFAIFQVCNNGLLSHSINGLSNYFVESNFP